MRFSTTWIELITVAQYRRQRWIIVLHEADMAGKARLGEALHVVEHSVNVDRPALRGPLFAEKLHAFDELHDPVRLVADQPRQLPVLFIRRLLEELRRAADARERILDLVGQHCAERRNRPGGAAMGHLPVHLVGDGSFLKHHDDVFSCLSHGRGENIDDAFRAKAGRTDIDAMLADAGPALTHILHESNHGRTERDEITELLTLHDAQAHVEKRLGGRVGVRDGTRRADRQTRAAAGHSSSGR